ncbi:MAG: DUF4263 domain-containing protein [Bacteroidetes bacterium]|nr:DUF4263 domain-containing protein [Bacteroidota bacterium]
MDKDKIENSFSPYSKMVAQSLLEIYWSKIYQLVKADPTLIKTVTGFLLKPEKIVLYFGKTHIALEYFGKETLDELQDENKFDLVYFDYTQTENNFFDQIVGFKFVSTRDEIEFPLMGIVEDLVIPTNEGMTKLLELGWNFDAQNFILSMNGGKYFIPENKFCRIINGLFFDADSNGLKTRQIKWIDFIPIKYDDSNPDYDTLAIDLNPYETFVEGDTHYIYPLPERNEYKYSKLPQINRFIELCGDKNTTEPMITTFLEQSENLFILSMAFFGKKIRAQLLCEWQSEIKPSIKPDFFIVGPNGFANIIEFKLPYLKSKTITGRANRETFSAEIQSYISQTRAYESYFDDPNNRKWFEDKYGFKVHKPKRILVVGRRWDFTNEEWRDIVADFKNVEIITYDDLVDGVTAQFYI